MKRKETVAALVSCSSLSLFLVRYRRRNRGCTRDQIVTQTQLIERDPMKSQEFLSLPWLHFLSLSLLIHGTETPLFFPLFSLQLMFDFGLAFHFFSTLFFITFEQKTSPVVFYLLSVLRLVTMTFVLQDISSQIKLWVENQDKRTKYPIVPGVKQTNELTCKKEDFLDPPLTSHILFIFIVYHFAFGSFNSLFLFDASFVLNQSK